MGSVFQTNRLVTKTESARKKLMQYLLQQGDLVENNRPLGDAAGVRIESLSHLQILHGEYPDFVAQVERCKGLRTTQLEAHATSLFGTLRLSGDQDKDHDLYFLILKNRLVIITQDDATLEALTQVLLVQTPVKLTLSMCIQRLFTGLAQREFDTLEEIEHNLSRLEEKVLEGKDLKAFTPSMSPYRKQIMYLHSYFERLEDVAQLLVENDNQLFEGKDLPPFRHLRSNVKRMTASTQSLRDYAMQVQEIYQSQVDIQQNNIMRALTVVTTIFLPLSLITSWYGMNFERMPELSWEAGYGMVILLSAVVVTVTIWIFKRKRYL